MLTSLLLMAVLAHPVGATPKLQSPIPGTCVTSPYGPRNTARLPRGASRYHKGCDYRGSCGTPVKAAAGGVVTYAGVQRGYGYRVEVRHADGTTTTYSHLQRGSFARGIRAGARVSAGQQLGRVGATGLRGMACHLHFEVLNKNRVKLNPAKFLAIPRCGRRGASGGRALNR